MRSPGMSPILAGSAVIHAGAALGFVVQPKTWPWALGAVVANHAVLTAAGLWPKSRLLGPNWTRLPHPAAARGAVAITIDDGPDAVVTPRVLDRLDEHRAQATFFCVGERIERHAEIAQEIIRRGHAIENHSQRHRHNFSLLGPGAMTAEIARAQESILRATGNLPMFFRAPAGLRNPFLDPILTHLQLRLASWTRRGFDTVDRNCDVVFRRLTRSLAGGDIVLLHDGNAATARTGQPVILEVLPRLLDAIRMHQLTPVTLRASVAASPAPR